MASVWVVIDALTGPTGATLKRGDSFDLSTDDATSRANYDRLIANGIVSATLVPPRPPIVSP